MTCTALDAGNRASNGFTVHVNGVSELVGLEQLIRTLGLLDGGAKVDLERRLTKIETLLGRRKSACVQLRAP